MKKIRSLMFFTALVFFTACHNPYSSTSQEPADEKEEKSEHSTMPSNETRASEHGEKKAEIADTAHAPHK